MLVSSGGNLSWRLPDSSCMGLVLWLQEIGLVAARVASCKNYVDACGREAGADGCRRSDSRLRKDCSWRLREIVSVVARKFNWRLRWVWLIGLGLNKLAIAM